MIIFKLLFIEKPEVKIELISAEAKQYFANLSHSSGENHFLFSFPDFEVNLIDAVGPAHCTVALSECVDLPDAAFQQNWHWDKANEKAKECKYEVLITDLLSRTLPYKQRLSIIMNFLLAITKATSPNVIYSVSAQKLINPQELINRLSKMEGEVLYGICNVRLYNITGGEKKEFLMDTIGLQSLGLPDFQIRLSGFKERTVASLLWNYAYYIYEQGDIVEDGNTLEGVTTGSKWKCERNVSLIEPERIVLNIQAN